jgi:DNA-binding transcriptional LysR family regulator
MNMSDGVYTKIDMNRALLKLIVKISETRNFTQAGLELHMTQPAVSRAVAALEDELGVRLLIRDPRHGVLLTDIGERIIALFREILHGYEKVDQEIAHEKGLNAGIVRIGAFPSASAFFIPKVIKHITNQFPNIEFEIVEGTVSAITDLIKSHRIEIGLVIQANWDDDLETFPLYKEKMHVVLRADHPLSCKRLIKPSDLSNQPLVTREAAFEPLEGWLRTVDSAQLHVKYELQNFMTALNMVREGIAIGLMSELSLGDLPEQMIARPIEPEWYRDIHIAVSSLKNCSLAARLFIDTARRLFPFAP